MSTPRKYAPAAMTLHWVITLLVLYNIFFPPEADEIGPAQLPGAVGLHASIGLTILVLIIARIFFRLGHAAPALPASMPVWQKRLAVVVQWTLDGALIVMVLAGLSAMAYAPFHASAFGLIPLDIFAPGNEDLHEAIAEVHEAVNKVILVLFTVHAAAAVYHGWIRRDGVMQTMLPWGK